MVFLKEFFGEKNHQTAKKHGSRPKGHGFELYWRHCVVFLSKNINPSLVLVQHRKTHPNITERLLMGRKESNQTNNKTKQKSMKNYPGCEELKEDNLCGLNHLCAL